MNNNNPIQAAVHPSAGIPQLPYELQIKVLDKLTVKQLVQFVKNHPDPAVWSKRYDILWDVYSHKESMTLTELIAFKKLFSLGANLLQPIKSWTQFANDPKFNYKLENLKQLDLRLSSREGSKFTYNYLSDEDLLALASLCPNMTSIKLDGQNQITSPSINALVQACPNLTSIHLNSCKITDSALEEIAPLCPNLTSINLRICKNITDRGVEALAKACPNLTSINLGLCSNITDRGVEALNQNCPNLTSIELFRNKNITNASVQALAQKGSLISINLEGCEKITNDAVQTIAECSPKLTEIHLSNFEQIDQGIRALAQHCPNLAYIGLYAVSISDGLLQTITRFSNLSKLEFEGCQITDATLQAIALGCPKLAEFTLFQGKITRAGLQQLIERCPLKSINLYCCYGIKYADIQLLEKDHPHIKFYLFE